mmetsp:Transcript_11955/g.35740  ORF Transcript_11955/g.35740 Transcript_11955/m.35740 type:complete len:279 (+) Transcript_11955:207-1043(+)
MVRSDALLESSEHLWVVRRVRGVRVGEDEVVDGRDGHVSVVRVPGPGHAYDEIPTGFENAPPRCERPQRIGEVLQHVERHDDVVGSVGDVLEAPSVADAQPPQEAVVHVEGGPARRFRSNRLDARDGSILFRPVDDVHGRPSELCVQATDVRRGAANLQRARVPRQSDYFLLKRLQCRGARGDATTAQGQGIGIVGTRAAKCARGAIAALLASIDVDALEARAAVGAPQRVPHWAEVRHHATKGALEVHVVRVLKARGTAFRVCAKGVERVQGGAHYN